MMALRTVVILFVSLLVLFVHEHTVDALTGGWGRRTVYHAYYTREQRCCDGWKSTSSGACTIPICPTPCYNGGTCVGPDSCSCPTTHGGKHCESAHGWGRRIVYTSFYTREPRCCDGWNSTSSGDCTVPICPTPCYNGGTCVGPDKCSCPPSHGGKYCATLLCSYKSPCFPGACYPPSDCRCSTGHGPDSGSKRCLTFTSSNPAPKIAECEYTFSNIRRKDNKQLFYFRGLCGNDNTAVDLYWTNQASFNLMELKIDSSYQNVDNMPPRPVYVSDTGFGIIGSSVKVLHTKVNREGIIGPLQTVTMDGDGTAYVAYGYEYVCTNGAGNLTPINMSHCSIVDNDYTTIIEHGDNLTATFVAHSGGFRKLYNTDSRRHYQTDYFTGLHTNKTVKFRFDFMAPLHCSEAATRCPVGEEEPMLLDKDITQDPVEVRWGGWSDEMSGIASYYLELFKLSLNIHGELAELEPLQPVETFTTNQSDINSRVHTFTPPEAGMYSILLQASDHANNSRIARRLVLYDNTSSVTITKPGFVMSNDIDQENVIIGDGGMYVTTAAAETGYRWQTSRNGSVTNFILDWQNHFRNILHEHKGFLKQVIAYPTQFEDLAEDGVLRSSKVVDFALDDFEGRRTMDPITNIQGVVKYEFKAVATADRSEPTSGWMEIPLREQYSFSRILTDGSFLRLWVKATDVLNNTIADYTRVHIDNTPPLYSHENLTKNIQNGSFVYTSIITMDAVDIQSGVHKIGFDIHIKNGSDVLKSGSIPANRNNESDACHTDTDCQCTLGQCFLANQTLHLDNCWFMVPEEDLNKSAAINVHVYNQALLKTSFTLWIDHLYNLNGLEEYSGPTNIRVIERLPFGVRLAWDLPKTASCYGRAAVMIILYSADGTPSVHYIYNEATTYDLVGLAPDQQYSMSLNLRYDGTNLAAIPYKFETAPKENHLSGGAIGGVVVGILVLIGLLLAVFVVLLRHGHMQPVQRGIRAMSVRYRNGMAKVRMRVSTNDYAGISNMSANTESLYMYGDMDFSASKSSHLTRNDVVFDSLLNSGHFADIYLAHQESNMSAGQVVAKVLKESHNDGDEYLMRAKFNFTSLVVGHHENIVRFVGAVVSDSEIGPFLIYEYCSKGTLKNYLVDSKPNVTEELQENLFRFGLGVVRGMTYLAEKKIVHRRLAARNILLDSGLNAKIHGFGPQPDETKDEQFMDGNTEKRERIPIRWCAPECFKSTIGATEKSDVWSYGVVLWEIFSLGDNPYGNIQARDLPSRIKAGERMKKPELCDDKWYSVMQRAWNQTPDKRPSFKVIRDELDELFVSAPTDDYYFYRR